jgi:hypothetical protein
MTPEELQALLDRGLRVPAEDREAFHAGAWQGFIARRLPSPPWWQPSKRAAWKRAFAAASSLTSDPTTQAVLIAPTWICDNDTEDASADWQGGFLLIFEDSTADLAEAALPEPQVIRAIVERRKMGYLAPSHAYALDVLLPYRNQHFAAVENSRILTVREIVAATPAEPIERPSRAIPPFSREVALAVDESALATRMRAAVRNALVKL